MTMAKYLPYVDAFMVQPRADVRPEELCFAVSSLEMTISPEPERVGTAGGVLGFFQLYADGTAGWWLEPMQRATPARDYADAMRAIMREARR